MLPAAAIIECVAAALQLAAIGRIVWRNFQGIGKLKVPYNHSGVPEEKWIAVFYCLLQVIVWVRCADYGKSKTTQPSSCTPTGTHTRQQKLHPMIFHIWKAYHTLTISLAAHSYVGLPSQTSLNAMRIYARVQILVDLFLTMQMQNTLLAVTLCIGSLTCAVMLGHVDSSFRGVMFALGFSLFVLLCLAVTTSVKAVMPSLPARALNALYTAMALFFGMWPMFPLLWALGPTALGVITSLQLLSAHAVLDVLCKSVFALALQSFRVLMEDTGIFYKYTLTNRHMKTVVSENLRALAEKQH